MPTSSVAMNQTNSWAKLLQEVPHYQGNHLRHCKKFYETIARMLDKNFPETCREYNRIRTGSSLRYLHLDKVDGKLERATTTAMQTLNACVEKECSNWGDTQNSIRAEQQSEQKSEEKKNEQKRDGYWKNFDWEGWKETYWEQKWRQQGPIPTNKEKASWRCFDCVRDLSSLIFGGPYDILGECLTVCDTGFGDNGFNDIYVFDALRNALINGRFEAFQVFLTVSLHQNTIDKLFEILGGAYLQRSDPLDKQQFSDFIQALIKRKVSPDQLSLLLTKVILNDNSSTKESLEKALLQEAYRIPSSNFDYVFQTCSERNLIPKMVELIATGKISAVKLGQALRVASKRGNSDLMKKLLETHRIPQEDLVSALSEPAIKGAPSMEKLYQTGYISLQDIRQAVQRAISEIIYGRVEASGVEIETALRKFGLVLPETIVPNLLRAALSHKRLDVVRAILNTHQIAEETAYDLLFSVPYYEKESGLTGMEDIAKMLLEAYPLSSEQFLQTMRFMIRSNSSTVIRPLLEMIKSKKNMIAPEDLKAAFFLAIERGAIEVVKAFQESNQISQKIAKEALRSTAPFSEELRKTLEEWKTDSTGWFFS